MSEPEIRSATISDFLQIAKLDRTAWGENRSSEFIPDGEHVWRLWVEYSLVDCAILDDRIIGVASSFATNRPNLYFVHKLFLQPDMRGQGVGKLLMDFHCSTFDRNGLTAKLTTDTNNSAMQRTSELCGFNQRELIKNYYRPNEDRFIYTRSPRLRKD